MNRWLKGNGYWCPACKGTGRGQARDMIEWSSGAQTRFYDLCSTCNGEKRLVATPEQIIAGTVPKTPDPEHHTLMSQCIEHTPGGRTR